MRKSRPVPVSTEAEKHPKPPRFKKITTFFEMPKIELNLPLIELTGNKELAVDGCKGVLEYDENVIRLNLKNYILRITGRDLGLTCLTTESLVVRGTILSVEFQS